MQGNTDSLNSPADAGLLSDTASTIDSVLSGKELKVHAECTCNSEPSLAGELSSVGLDVRLRLKTDLSQQFTATSNFSDYAGHCDRR